EADGERILSAPIRRSDRRACSEQGGGFDEDREAVLNESTPEKAGERPAHPELRDQSDEHHKRDKTREIRAERPRHPAEWSRHKKKESGTGHQAFRNQHQRSQG